MAFEVTAETPRSNITIAGLTFSVPEPFSEGHVLDANEAGVLNQTYAENIRNNQAAMVAEAKEKAEKEGGSVDLAALQSAIDDYTANYQFGQRRGGASGDPVEREALNQAREIVRQKIREKGGKLSDYKAADITAKAQEVLGKYPQIREKARITVEAQQKAASELAGDSFDVSI